MKRDDGLDDFKRAGGEIPEDVRVVLVQTENNILIELRRSRSRFFASFFSFSVIGYFLSLSVCSQNSVALTNFSIDVAKQLHQLPNPICPIVCGIVFSIIPVLAIFLFLDRFQRRRLVVQFWWLPVTMALLTCLFVTFLPPAFQHQGMQMHHNAQPNPHEDVVWLLWWTIAAVSVPLGATLVAKIKMSR